MELSIFYTGTSEITSKKYKELNRKPKIIIIARLDIDRNLLSEYLTANNQTGKTKTMEEIRPGT